MEDLMGKAAKMTSTKLGFHKQLAQQMTSHFEYWNHLEIWMILNNHDLEGMEYILVLDLIWKNDFTNGPATMIDPQR